MGLGKTIMFKWMGGLHVGMYRMSGGAIGGKMLNHRVCLLTTTGRKSGKTRTMPLLCLEEGEKVSIIASRGGDPRNPAWYHNLMAKPEVEIQLGKDTRQMVAEVVEGEEHQRIWDKMSSRYAGYNSYAKKAGRTIPVVTLRPRGEAEPPPQ
jgi:deazaflavin-dependent oxidoreductase (nitroreductase family)